MTVIFEAKSFVVDQLRASVFGRTQVAASVREVYEIVSNTSDQLVLIGPTTPISNAVEIAKRYRVAYPTLGVVLVRDSVTEQNLKLALESGIRAVVRLGDATAIERACRESLAISEELRNSLGTPGALKLAHVVVVFAAKGGVGKTTVCANLALALAKKSGGKVCLVDLDMEFADVGIYLNKKPEKTISELGRNLGEITDSVLANVVTKINEDLDLVMGPTGPTEAEYISNERVLDLVRILRKRYDYIVIDTKSSFTELNLALFDIADRIQFVTTLDVPAIKNLRVASETLDVLGYPRSKQAIALNRADSKVGLNAKDAEDLLGQTIGSKIPSSGDVIVALNNGQALFESSPNHAFSKAISRLALDITETRGGTPSRSESPAPVAEVPELGVAEE